MLVFYKSAGRSGVIIFIRRKMVIRNNHHVETSLLQNNTNSIHLGPPDGAVNGDLLVSPDTEATNGITGLGEHWGLSSQRLQHL